jgi:hypothetical protein
VLREVGMDTPIAHGVGIGQRIAGNHAAETQMVQPGRLRTKTSFNIAQALAPGQLRERQAQILIKARKALDLAFTTVTDHATTKRRQWQMLHELGKDVMALLHEGILACGSARVPFFVSRLKSRPPKNLYFIFSLKALASTQHQTLGH